MKEKIYTIPLIDAFKEDSECPFCTLYHTLEKESIEFMLGPSYMEDDIRMETNKIGFCPDHYKQMFYEKNRLGLALMIHTHLEEINKNLSEIIASNKDLAPKKNSFFHNFIKSSNKDENTNSNNPLSSYLNNIYDDCYICNKIENTFDRYMDTFFYLWKKNKEFVSLVSNSKGFCLNHFSMLINNGESLLSKDQYINFTQIIIPIQLKNLKKLEEDIHWFIQKFDYRFKDEPWKDSKDALQRSLLKLSSVKTED